MSEYMWAKIEIGGKVGRPVLTNLVDKFDVSAALLEKVGAETASPETIYQLEREDTEAPWGQFAELEAYLMEQAVPFDRASDGGYEHSPELRRFRPRLTDADGKISQPETDRTFLCDHDNRPTVALMDVKKAIAETQTRQELAARLVGLCGLDIPGLPPLSVVEAVG